MTDRQVIVDIVLPVVSLIINLIQAVASLRIVDQVDVVTTRVESHLSSISQQNVSIREVSLNTSDRDTVINN